MKIQHPSNYKYQDDEFLCRYFSMPKFIDLFFNQNLHFTRLDHFEDNLEGITVEGAKHRKWFLNPPLTEENINEGIPKELITWEANQRKEHYDSLKFSQTSQYASCWFQGDRESIAMWKLYSNSNGLMLKFRMNELIKYITISAESFKSDVFLEMCYDKISYKKLNPFDYTETFDNVFNGLKKDVAYEHEKEFRFIVVCDAKDAGKHSFFRLPIGSLKDFDFLEIYSNPFMRDWEFDNNKKLFRLFNLENKLKKSEIDVKLF